MSTHPSDPAIRLSSTLEGVDWVALDKELTLDRFNNGRTPDQLHESFANSYSVVFVWASHRVIGTARVLSDGVGNAYMVDVWTNSEYRNRGIARSMIEHLMQTLKGQHVYLQADDDSVEFYIKLGFLPQPQGLSKIVGKYLNSEAYSR